MFCNQCEQTAHGTACVDTGVCGKSPDLQSLQETLLYGIKGMAAYAHHARRLGKVDEEVSAFIEEGLFATLTNVNFDMGTHIELLMKCGQMNYRTMQLLDEGHVEMFGAPSPATVYEGTREGPGILVTGHDMLDLYNLLKATEGQGVDVYTHGELLPAHMYPKLREFPHLVGHYGGAWQKQKTEFARFNGPILATTNCVLIPPDTYADRLFGTRVTGVSGSVRILDDDYSGLIAKAKECAPLQDHPVKETTIGFHHSVVAGIADQIVDAVKAGLIERFFVIGGCDGAEPGRNYFSEYAGNTPDKSFVLTVGCGKYRIRDNDFGTLDLPGVGPLPRLLDMGQCNDSYGAIQVALALSKAFDCGLNDLPVTIVLSWFEQKAVAVLLTLLSLGVKGIRIGPAAPGFLTPDVAAILKEEFDLDVIGSDWKTDLRAACEAM